MKKPKETEKNIKTDSGIPIEPLYQMDPEFNYHEKLGNPGEYPFTRGIQPNMYRGRLWTMRQYAGFGSAEESNKRYKYLLANGITGLSVAFDLPTQMGYDSDHPVAQGEVGKVGVPVSSLADMEILLEGIRLEEISTSMTINSTASILLSMYITLAKKQGADLRKISGTIQNDILKEYIARGTYIYPPKYSLRIVTDIFKYCAQHLPAWNNISISGYHIREAGSTAAQEIGFTLSNGIAYVESAIQAGLDVDQFASRLSFFFNAHNHFFEEIAKFRAARRLWAKIMKERFHAKDPRSLMLRFHAQTAGSTLTAQQPDNNIIRVTLQALAAVLGGTQSLHTNSKDEALALPTEESVQIALRTQQIIAYESGVPETADPLGGSYFIEKLTDELESKAKEYIEKVDSLGGAISAIEANYFQDEIMKSAYQNQTAIDQKQKIIVGVNEFKRNEEVPQHLLKIEPAVVEKQISRLKKLKKERDQKKVTDSLKNLSTVSRTDQNLLPAIIECVSNYVTLGEISDELRRTFGEYET